MRERLQRAIEERARIVREQDTIVSQDDPSTEDLERWDRLDADFRRLTTDIDRLNATIQRSQDLETVHRPVEMLPGGADAAGPPARAAQYRAAWDAWARRGMAEITPDQQQLVRSGHRDLSDEARALGTLTGPIGGYTIPNEYLNELQRVMRFFGGMLSTAQVLTTATGASLSWPTMDDTTNKGRRVTENSQISQTDVAFGQKSLDAYVYTSDAVLVQYTLLQDASIPLEQVLFDALGERIGRIVNEELTTGTGVSMPEGLLTNIVTGATGATGQTTTVEYDDLINLEYSLDRAYRNERCRYMMHDKSLAVVRKIKDGNGQIVFAPSFQAGEPDRLLSYPITINNDMPEMAASAKSIAFGDIYRAYLVRSVQDVQMVRATERWIDYMQVGFFAFVRLDGILREPNAVRVYANAAS